MRLLVDQNLPPRLASLLSDAGHDAVHVRDLDLAKAPDAAILDLAVAEDRTIISADTDFGALLAYGRSTKPSVVLVREIVGLTPAGMAERAISPTRGST